DANVRHDDGRVRERVPLKVADPGAWRRHPIRRLGLSSRTTLAALRAFRWRCGTGDVKAVIRERRLTKIGDLHDYIHVYGRRLTEVPGLGMGTIDDVLVRLAKYGTPGALVDLGYVAPETREGRHEQERIRR
ncbi:hypothetical protein G3V85_23915, partial [Escherichia coli]|nr:hypothetical protein [Escherichia coli]